MKNVHNNVELFTEKLTVQSGDCDFTRGLTPMALLRRMQEAAFQDAHRLGLDADSICSGVFHWVLGRMAIELNGPLPLWQDEWTLETWITGYDRLFAWRNFAFSSQGQLWGQAATSWILIDAEERKPVQPIEAFGCKDLIFTAAGLEPARRLRAQPTYTAAPPIPVGYRDVDLHNHVNNTRYLAYFMDSFPRQHFLTQRLERFEVNFLQELVWGDRAIVGLTELEPGRWAHAVHRQDSNVCAVAETRWKPL